MNQESPKWQIQANLLHILKDLAHKVPEKKITVTVSVMCNVPDLINIVHNHTLHSLNSIRKELTETFDFQFQLFAAAVT